MFLHDATRHSLQGCLHPQDGSWILHFCIVDYGNLIFEVDRIESRKGFSLIKMVLDVAPTNSVTTGIFREGTEM